MSGTCKDVLTAEAPFFIVNNDDGSQPFLDFSCQDIEGSICSHLDLQATQEITDIRVDVVVVDVAGLAVGSATVTVTEVLAMNSPVSVDIVIGSIAP